ncbi:Smr/MutS family protein [Candidatus Pelagibacter sp.]|nr:Smr/MutS family protein [Candidatus Pelagibacter sp.]
MTNRISDKDKKDWEEFLSSSEKLQDKDHKLKKKKQYKIKSIDLHGYSLKKANETIQYFINKSYEENVNRLIVITGKGLHSNNEKDPYVSKNLSILKYSVPEFIENNIELKKKILEITNAKIEDGGEGAFYIHLKRKK